MTISKLNYMEPEMQLHLQYCPVSNFRRDIPGITNYDHLRLLIIVVEAR